MHQPPSKLDDKINKYNNKQTFHELKALIAELRAQQQHAVDVV